MARRTTTVEFSDFERIHERLDRAWERLIGGPGSPSSFGTRYYEPPADVYQTEIEVVVLVEMAGIASQEIQLEMEGRNLLIRGRREPLAGPDNREYSQIEITDGPFQRALLLPAPVSAQGVAVTYSDGILKIVLPKAPSSGGTRLRIICR
jgi:HSP20 family protein